jgi:hypothetical protein
VLFLLWAFRRPLADQLDDGSGSVEFGGGPRGDGNRAVGNGNARA